MTQVQQRGLRPPGMLALVYRRSDTVVPPYSRVIRSKTYCGYVKLRIVPNAIYNVIFV
jgi:hypothetical protein